MKERQLSLEIMTPDGDRLKEAVVAQVVVRRREKYRELGSEVAIYPFHGPTLVRIPVAPIRYSVGDEVRYVVVSGGFVEVKKDNVLIVTPRFEQVEECEDPRAEAWELAEKWRAGTTEFGREMIGYLPSEAAE